MEDFRAATSTDFLYKVGNVFLRFQLWVFGTNLVVYLMVQIKQYSEIK